MISIVTPTFKRPRELVKAVVSVQRQSFADWQLYVVGDCCPDAAAVMTPIIKADPRVHFHNLDKNYGPGGAEPRNYALRNLVKTQYCAFLDDDNTWTSEHLQSLWNAIKSGPYKFALSSIVMDGILIYFDLPIRRGRIDTSCVLFDMELVRHYGYWQDRTSTCYAHDFLFFIKWHTEAGIATRKATLLYSCQAGGQNPMQIRAMYNDDQVTPGREFPQTLPLRKINALWVVGAVLIVWFLLKLLPRQL
jgi:glycosyltransferase involved in cell wall biosynthesis